jgi:hypothetical protein
MSNYRAIAAVSAAMQQILTPTVLSAVSGSSVVFTRPSRSDDDGPVVSVFLYQVTPNAAFRNHDLPTRRANGDLVHKPLAALELHYLITFYGSDAALEPQLMMGAVVSMLQAQPLLSPQSIENGESYLGIGVSNLSEQVERVRFTPTTLTLDEFSKLWSAFFQVEYSLSIAYQASVVLIEPDTPTPEAALPVLRRNLYLTTFQEPSIVSVASLAGANQPILPTSTLLIAGTNLLAGLTQVRIGNTVVTPPSVTATAIRLPVPAGVPAGVLGVQVIQQRAMGTPAEPHPGVESNVVAMVLQPVLSNVAYAAGAVTFDVVPDGQIGQKVTLLLNEATAPPPADPVAYTFTLPPLATASSSYSFDTPGTQAGTTYFVRLAVDGAESPLDLDPTSPAFGPTVTIP